MWANFGKRNWRRPPPSSLPPCVSIQNASVCTFKTSPCQHHAHMLKHICAWCRYTRGRFECIHGGVLDGHTGVFTDDTTTQTNQATNQHTHTTKAQQHTATSHYLFLLFLSFLYVCLSFLFFVFLSFSVCSVRSVFSLLVFVSDPVSFLCSPLFPMMCLVSFCVFV